MLYEFSVACQMAGAIILLIWSFSKVSKNAIEMCFSGISVIGIDNEGKGVLEKEKLQKNVSKIMLNVYAFTCIAIGYLTSVFAQNDMENLWVKVFYICLITSILIAIGMKSSLFISKYWFQEDVKLSNEAIERYEALIPITSNDINSLFKKF